LAIVLSVVRFATSDYPIGMLKLFWWMSFQKQTSCALYLIFTKLQAGCMDFVCTGHWPINSPNLHQAGDNVLCFVHGFLNEYHNQIRFQAKVLCYHWLVTWYFKKYVKRTRYVCTIQNKM